MKMKTNIRTVIQIKSMNDFVITLIIVTIDLRERRIRVTLRTLNVRNTRTVRKAYRFPAPPPPWEAMIISTIDRMTIAPSRRFIRSLAYFFGPLASNFMAISDMKIQVNISFMNSRFFAVSLSMSYASIAIPMVLKRTQIVIAFSNIDSLVNAFNRHLTFLIQLY